ncbi:MAG: FG-GAP repeat protein [Verrucomicrobiaceae bacterium]|nr:FG-GAP repeat protein [Verrucomicrobiaceae bacterium]
MKTRLLFLLVLILVAAVCPAALPPKTILAPLGGDYASAMCLTPTTLVMGFPQFGYDSFNSAGEVRIFSRSTGKLVRKIRSTSPTTGNNFGHALACVGNTLLVGVPGGEKVEIFALSSGKFLGQMVPATPVGAGIFGWALAVEGPRVCVGAPNDNGFKGAVYVMDLRTRGQLLKLIAGDGVAGDQFGYSVAVSGGLVVTGAVSDDHGATADAGSAYLFDAVSGSQINKFIASDMAASRAYGVAVALRGEVAFVSSIKGDTNRGAVSMVDAPNAFETRLLTGGGVANGRFGATLSLSDNLLAVSRLYSAEAIGGVTFFDSRTGERLGELNRTDSASANQAPMQVALQGGTAATAPTDIGSGATSSRFAAIYPGIQSPAWDDAFLVRGAALTDRLFVGQVRQYALSSLGDPKAFVSVTGPDSTGGRNQIFVSLDGLLVGVGLQTGVTSSGIGPKSLALISENLPNTSVLRLNGEISGLKNQDMLSISGVGASSFVRTSAPIGGDAPESPTKIHRVRQSYDSTNFTWAFLYSYAGLGGNKALDTALRAATTNNTGYFRVYEGTPAPTRVGDPPGPVFGEFAKRLSLAKDAVFSAALTSAPTGTGQGVFRRAVGGANQILARQGEAAPGSGGATYNAFLAEAGSNTGMTIFRATLKGGDATTAKNEGLWRSIAGGTPTLLARKGFAVNGIAGAVWKKFIRLWCIGNQVLILGQISGTGVTSANDTLLILLQENDTWLTLMREGDPAPGCPDGAVAAVQRLELDPDTGRYVALVSLSGASAATNQALLAGDTLLGTPFGTYGRRLPHLLLRKGTAHQNGFSALGTLKSLALRSDVQDPSGATGIGEARCIRGAEGSVLVELNYGTGGTRLVKMAMP